MQGIEIQTNNKPDKKLTKKIRLDALKKGLITYECGINGNVIGLMPPLVIRDEEFNRGIEIIINSIKKS